MVSPISVSVSLLSLSVEEEEEDDVKFRMKLSVLGFCLHVTVLLLFLSLFSVLLLSTNRRRPNWSMPTLRNLNRVFSLKRPKQINSRES